MKATLASLLFVVLMGGSPPSQDANLNATKIPNVSQQAAVAAVQKLGGRVAVEPFTVDLGGTKVTDAGLKHLKSVTSLQSLDLWGTKVTDAGL